MRCPRLTLAALGPFVFLAAVFTIPNGSSGDGTKTTSVASGPSLTQMNDPKVQIGFLDQRVTDLETKLATLQRQLTAAQQQAATHTHSYQRSTPCTEFTSLVNLQDAVSHPNNHPGLGICFTRGSTVSLPPLQTSAPGK